MKSLIYINAILLFLIVVACNKHSDYIVGVVPPNTAPHASAGLDFLVFLPDNSVIIEGKATDNELDEITYSWKKIKGADSYRISNPGMTKAELQNLEKGEYEFELTALDARGLSGKDTLKLQVLDKPRNEIITNNFSGGCPFGCYFKINITLPPNKPFRVFVQPSISEPKWFEAVGFAQSGPNDRYNYEIVNGELAITSNDVGFSNLRIVFD